MSTVGGELGEIQTSRSLAEVQAAAEGLSKAGKLPGFERTAEGFGATCFGEPFDYAMSAKVEGGRVRFALAMQAKMPLIFAGIVAVTLWPGVWLTDSMLRTYFTGYDVATWMWYVPLTVVPTAIMVPRMVSKSRRAAQDHAAELIGRLRSVV